MRFLRGFTFAELLCVIIIIGCSAMIAIPIVYATYSKYAAADRLKKFYSTMKATLLKSKIDGNDWMDYFSTSDDVTLEMFLDKYILQYIKYHEKYTDEEGNVGVLFHDATSFLLKNDENENCLTFVFDLNNTKKPNLAGRDLFYFNYCSDNETVFLNKGEFSPYYTEETIDRSSARTKCIDDPKYCSGLIIHDNFEFERDYPFSIPI